MKMKKEWVKPEIRFTTDPDIILGCLYEVYGQEQKSVLAGKNIRHTMIFPFLRMLANNTQGDVRDLEALHQRLWKIYEKEPEKQVNFVSWITSLSNISKGEDGG